MRERGLRCRIPEDLMRYLVRVDLVFDGLKSVAPAEVAAGADRLGLMFPDGYAEYMAELGEGDPLG